MSARRQVIEIAAGDVAAELRRQGIGAEELVTLTIEPDRDIIPGRGASRALVVAACLSDTEIDRLVKQAQLEVEPRP